MRAATEVVRSTVVVARREAGEPRLDRLPVLGVTPQRLTRTLDPGVREGTVEELRPGTVAVGADRARSLDARPGSVVTLRFGDGAQARLRVVAIYERSLALGTSSSPGTSCCAICRCRAQGRCWSRPHRAATTRRSPGP
ncbi:hypothetical protein O1L68_19315 [Streptomyces lydicus]|nr:hypothetical protein [Streptomyces lydicus]